MGVQCTTMVVDKVSVVIILFIVLVSVPEGFRVILGMLEWIRSTKALFSGSDGIHINTQCGTSSGCPVLSKVGIYWNLDDR